MSSPSSPNSPPPDWTAEPGARVGSWRLLTLLGAGAFGETWRAEGSTGLPAAIKLLRGPPGDELRALAGIGHPGVVGLLDAGGAPVPHIVMEFVPGRPLSRWILEGSIDLEAACGVAGVLADAVAAVHDADIVHGDLKPDNVVAERVSLPPSLRVVDFGEAGGEGGTPAYAAPERFQGGAGTAASDVYSLGLIIWELLHGALPYADLPSAEAMAQRATQPPVPTVGPPWLMDLVRRMLLPDPESRPPAAAVADELAVQGFESAPLNTSLIQRRARTVFEPPDGWDDASTTWLTHGGQLAIVGDPGSGRSTLLDRLELEIEANGLAVSRPADASRAWGLARLMLQDAGGDGEAEAALSGIPPAGRASAYVAAIAALSPVPLRVLVDDIHTLDEGSGDVLWELAQRGLVHVAAAGPTAPPWASHTYTISNLTERATAAMVSGLLGQIADPKLLRDGVWRATEGRPGRVLPFLLDAVDRGALTWRARRWLIDRNLLQDTVRARAGVDPEPIPLALSSAARSMGALVAVRGEPVSLGQLARLTGCGSQDVDAAMGELLGTGLVRIDGRGARTSGPGASAGLRQDGPCTTLAHRVWLDALVAQEPVPVAQLPEHLVGSGDPALVARWGTVSLRAMSTEEPERARRLAEALLALHDERGLHLVHLEVLGAAGDREAAAQVAASLLAQTLSPDEAARVGLVLARLALTKDAPEEALAKLASARDAVDPVVRRGVVETEARAFFSAHDHEAASAAARTAIELGPGEDQASADHFLAMSGLLAQSLLDAGDPVVALAALPDVNAAPMAGPTARALLEGIRGRLLYHAGQRREAAQAMDRAAVANSGVSAVDRARMLNNAATATYLLGDRPGALARWEEALLGFERLGARVDQIRVQVNLCVGYREAGRWGRSKAAGEWAVQAARADELPPYEAMAAGNLCDLYLARSRVGPGRAWFEYTKHLADEHDLESERVELARRHAELAVLEKDPTADAIVEEALRVARGAGDVVGEAITLTQQAVLLAREGRVDDVRTVLELASDRIKDDGSTSDLYEVRLHAARAWLAADNHAEALDCATKVVVYAEEVGAEGMAWRARQIVDQARQKKEARSSDGALARVLELSSRVHAAKTVEEALDVVACGMLELLEGDRAFVLDGPGLDIRVMKTREGAGDGPPSSTIVKRAVERRTEVIAFDLHERDDLQSANSISVLSLRCAMCVPLVADDTVMGVVYVDSKKKSEREMAASRDLIRWLAAHAAEALWAARKREEDAARIAELERLTRLKDEFVATMPHEIRTPLHGILGSAELLIAEIVGEDRRHLEDIRRSGQALLALVDDILDVSRNSAISLAITAFDVGALVSAVHAGLAPEAQARGLTLELEHPGGSSRLGDPERIRQVLHQLVDNAVRFTSVGGVKVVVTAGEADRVCFEVTDTGMGIAEADLGRIFEPFTQVDQSMSRRHGGAGLGLTVARKLVKAMGGQLTVESEVGRGTTFRFEIDLPAATKPAEMADEQPATSQDPVLVVDDNPINLRVVCRMLEHLGYTSIAVDSGADAVKAVAEGRYLAVLMDLQMPGMDGFEAVRRIRRLGARGEAVPISALTANTSDDDRARCASVGMDHFLAKPVSLDVLAKTIAELARGRKVV